MNVIIISVFSFISITIINNSTQDIINKNVRHKEELSAIIRNMYEVRVLGRDILLATDDVVVDAYYIVYINKFEQLDRKMEEYKTYLSGDKLDEFTKIIEQKDIYKEAMILSADIWIEENDFDAALSALQSVTPIANSFFGSIDIYSTDEEIYMNEAISRNNELVNFIVVIGLLINIFIIVLLYVFTTFFEKSMSASLIKLEKSMSEIAETGNMKIQFPSELYTNDEVGRITTVANKMKTMLLEYSFNDVLTGGYNAKAYHEELNSLFIDNNIKKELFCVIADMNNLKLINDYLGHLEGDNALKKAYNLLNENLKDYGKTFRVGGDEFVSILPNCCEIELSRTIEHILKEIDDINKNADYKFSLAIGTDKFIGYTLEEYNEFFKSVDKKMYDNKLQLKQSRINARLLEDIELQKQQ